MDAETVTFDPPRVALRRVEELIPYVRNARTHSPGQIAKLKGLIQEFGWTNPILADGSGLVAGHGRTMAARELYAAGETIYLPPGRTDGGRPLPRGMVPVIDCSGWSEAKRRAYVLADNKAALDAGWDLEMLKVELLEIETAGIDIAFTGFEVGEIEAMEVGPPAGLPGSSSVPGEAPAAPGEGPVIEEPYSRKIKAPIYTPKGEKPAPADLVDARKTDALLAAIREAAHLPPDVAAFLEHAAQRHTVFNFAKVADFYAHSDAATQRLMEDSALVIVDFKQAIESGFVKLTKRLGDLVARDYPEGGEDAGEALDEAA